MMEMDKESDFSIEEYMDKFSKQKGYDKKKILRKH